MHARGPGSGALTLLQLLSLSSLLLAALPARAAAPRVEIDHLDVGGATKLQFVAPAGTSCKVDKGGGLAALEREGASFVFDAAGGKAYSFWCKLPDGTPWASKVFARGGKVTRISLNGATAALPPPPAPPPPGALAAGLLAAPVAGGQPDTAPVDSTAPPDATAATPATPGTPATATPPPAAFAAPGTLLTGPRLEKLLRSMRRTPFPRERLELADAAFAEGRPTVASVLKLLRLFEHEHDRLQLLAVLGDRLADPEHTRALLRSLPYEGDRLRAERLLRGAPVAPAWW